MLDSEIQVFQDREEPLTWRVEYFDGDGGCYVTLFMGPAAERRAKDYAAMLISGIVSPL